LKLEKNGCRKGVNKTTLNPHENCCSSGKTALERGGVEGRLLCNGAKEKKGGAGERTASRRQEAKGGKKRRKKLTASRTTAQKKKRGSRRKEKKKTTRGEVVKKKEKYKRGLGSWPGPPPWGGERGGSQGMKKKVRTKPRPSLAGARARKKKGHEASKTRRKKGVR